MKLNLTLRSTAFVAASLLAFACSDDDDDSNDNMGAAGSDMGAAGSDMGAAGSDMGTGGSGMATGGDMPMSFFVSSTAGPEGGNFGGLAGADEFCTGLAEAAGSTGQTWKALLSTDTEDAKDRIGTGPWYNADSVMLAATVDDLLADGVAIGPTGDDFDAATDPKRAIFLDETGLPVSADPNEHDILTGTNPDGTAADNNCLNWTSSAATDLGMIGHSDSRGPQGDNTALGWLSTHNSQGCDLASLNMTGGNGRIYCFAE